MSDTPENEEHGIDERVDDLRNKAGDFLEGCLFRSAYRVYGELRRLGKNEQRVMPYISSVFHQMDLAQSLLDPKTTRDYAVELIALLEDEEQARKIQPDFPQEYYEAERAWMTACAYENLAEATGMLEGYNSHGMHQCITDGIEVCRRTGKLACVNCFREYAAQVYTAADDLDMALHHARLIASNAGPYPDRGDRRYLGARNEGWLMLLQGKVEPAVTSLRRSLELCDSEEVSIPASAKMQGRIELETALLLSGERDPGAEPEGGAGTGLAEGERPDLELKWAQTEACRACCRGDFPAAVAALSAWDRRLTEQRCLNDWFETRLRLIAAHRLAGEEARVEALAKPLYEKARKAQDWLTLRRLARLLVPSEAVSPVAAVAPLASGPFAGAGTRVSATVPAEPPAAAPADTGEPEAAPAPETPPLEEYLQGLFGRMESAGDDETRAEILGDMLALDPAKVTHAFDAARLLNLVRYLVGAGERGAEIWRWAEAVAEPFPRDADVLNLLAILGDVIRSSPTDGLDELISRECIEQLLRQSLDLDPDGAANFARAGAFFLGEDNHGEAERCLARSFRLERRSSFVALRLAEVYRQTERPRDALAVLDLCLREGGDDPQVAWEAALAAFRLEQYDAQLTYLDRFEELTEADEWACLYRATALLELGRPDEADAALDLAEERSDERGFAVGVLRACAAAARGDRAGTRSYLEPFLAARLADVNYLTITGMADLTARLWKASATLDRGDPLRAAVDERLLVSGMAPEGMFDEIREAGEELGGLEYHRVIVRQPLDETWPDSPGCLAGQEEWRAYRIAWGVLAQDEDDAAERVLAWQRRCCPLPPEVEEVTLQSDGFTDKPGVVWQGARWGDEPEESEDEDEVDREEA